jgi:predicted O-methyltransferase YrrM
MRAGDLDGVDVIKDLIKRIIRAIPYGEMLLATHSLRSIFNAERFPPGHYYSAIPDPTTIGSCSATPCPSVIKGIDLRVNEQLALFSRFADFYETPPFHDPTKSRRFKIENDSFSYDDAPILYYMLRSLKPRRIIEIGCGNSTACMLDINERYFNNSIAMTLIDIDLHNPRMPLLESDKARIRLHEQPVQAAELALFQELDRNDLLFIDSSHVVKHGSEVQHILFEILPVLRPGVVVHFHDISYPFDYPVVLLQKKIYWNEAYALRAFLMNNSQYSIYFWLNFLLRSHQSRLVNLTRFVPLESWRARFGAKPGYDDAGGSLYLQKNG